jgi:hypothetical protein
MAWPKGVAKPSSRDALSRLWKDPEFARRAAQRSSDRMRRMNKDPEFVAKVRAGARRWRDQQPQCPPTVKPRCCYCGCRTLRFLEPDGEDRYSCIVKFRCEARITIALRYAS